MLRHTDVNLERVINEKYVGDPVLTFWQILVWDMPGTTATLRVLLVGSLLNSRKTRKLLISCR